MPTPDAKPVPDYGEPWAIEEREDRGLGPAPITIVHGRGSNRVAASSDWVCDVGLYHDGGAHESGSKLRADRIVDCVNALRGMNPAAVAELEPLLRHCRGYLVSGDAGEPDRAGLELVDRIDAALARLRTEEVKP